MHEAKKTRSTYARKSNGKAHTFRQALFWDVDPKTINPHKHARYIIERVLELGNTKDVTWLFHYYPRQTITDILKSSRGVFHKKTKALWTLVLK